MSARLVAAMLLVFGTLGIAAQSSPDPVAARAEFETKLVRPGIEPEEPPVVPPAGSGVERVTYATELGDMWAYATPVRNDGKRRPALVWIKGGFGGIGPWAVDPEEADPENDQTVRTYMDAGKNGEELVVFLPSFRGTNANPGKYEMFLGEVDDVAAALEHVSKRPDVDPKRIYLAGHSTGGTVALLAAAVSDVPAGVVSFGGAPDMVSTVRDGGFGYEPFDTSLLLEAQMRSPMTYASAVDRPVLYIEGEDSAYPATAMRMARSVPGDRMVVVEVPGQDHFTILQPIHKLLSKHIIDAKPGLPSADEVLAAFPKVTWDADALRELQMAGSPEGIAEYRRTPLRLTPAAARLLRAQAAEAPALPEPVLWVRVFVGSHGYSWNHELIESPPPKTIITESGGIRIAVDEASAGALYGMSINMDADGALVIE